MLETGSTLESKDDSSSLLALLEIETTYCTTNKEQLTTLTNNYRFIYGYKWIFVRQSEQHTEKYKRKC